MTQGRLGALLEALLVTFLWSTSYILTKIGLTEISPLVLVSLRYVVASLILVPAAVLRGEHRALDGRAALKLVFLGITGYSVAQGLQCVGLYHLPAVTVTFILNFTPVIVLTLGLVFLKTTPTPRQVAGIALVIAGAYIYFGGGVSASSLTGVIVTFVSGLGWAAYLVASRAFFKPGEIGPLGLSAFAMGVGTVFIAGSAWVYEGFTALSLGGWGIVLWLGVVNTAAAFFLWNHALQRVEAFEISILQNTMLIQIAILSVIFLGEKLTASKMLGMAAVFVGVLIVQLSSLRGAV
ncbi:EamA family transporter, partial [Candidatus Bathyarchaeota archaeon]|nr:EamA family transporter [Candidatus Bathyarchaeota archaeon]